MRQERRDRLVRVATLLVVLSACFDPPPPASPQKQAPANESRKEPSKWLVHGGIGGGVLFSPPNGTFARASSADDARSFTRLPSARALSVSPDHLCEMVPALRAVAPRLSIDLTGPEITPNAAQCLGSIQPAAMSFTLEAAPKGPLIPWVVTLLTHLERCEALGIQGAGDSVPKLLAEREAPLLESLALGESVLSADGVASLAKLRRLRALGLSNMEWVDKRAPATGLEALANLPALEWLDLGYSVVTNEDVAALAHIKGLRFIRIAATSVDDVGFAELAHATSLETIDAGFTNVGDASIEAIAGLRKLTSITLTKTKVTDKSLALLRQHTPLREIRLELTAITEEALRVFNHMPELAVLALPEGVSEAAMERFRSENPKVKVGHLISRPSIAP